MVDVPTVSIVIASASVVAGVVYYAFQIRLQTRIRKTDLIVRLNPQLNIGIKEMMEDTNIIMALGFRDYDDFVQKYGSLYSGKPEANALRAFLNWGDGIGMLLKRKLVDIDIVIDSYAGTVPMLWEKFKPVVEGYRKEAHNPHYYEWLEYLVSEIQKRKQQLASKTA